MEKSPENGLKVSSPDAPETSDLRLGPDSVLSSSEIKERDRALGALTNQRHMPISEDGIID